jgi:membrane fusion protein (multidrug efflux system)
LGLTPAVLLVALVALGCHGKTSHDAGKASGAASAAPAAGATDSTTADSTKAAASDEEPKPGFLARVLKRGKKEEEKKDEAVPVEMATVVRRDLPAYVSFTATLEAEKQAEILAKISGEVREVRVEEGAIVKAGEVLAVLDGASQRVVLEEMDARTRALERDYQRGKRLLEQDLGSEKDVSDAEARYAEAEALRKGAELNLAYTRITAPYAGRIATRNVDPGQNVNVGTALFRIVDPDPLLASIHLPEKEVARLSVGQEVTISPDTDSSASFSGSVLRIAPVVDDRTGTVKVTCRVNGETSALRPGSFVRVKLQTALHRDVLTIPKRALVPEGTDNYLFHVVGDSVAKIPVLIGITDNEDVEVMNGVAEGDRIVTVGQGALKPGSKIKEVPRRTPAAEAPKEDSVGVGTP